MASPTPPTLGWAQAWRFARRDLTRALRGLRLLLVCLFLGTMALAAIGTLTGAIERELSGRGQTMLGGDIEVSLYRPRPCARRAGGAGRNSATFPAARGCRRWRCRCAMPACAVPVELKAVDSAWPLYGALTLQGGKPAKAPTGHDRVDRARALPNGSVSRRATASSWARRR